MLPKKALGVSEPVSIHANWYTVDPVVGCPYRCEYCYLKPFGLTNSKPLNRGLSVMKLFNLLEKLEASIPFGNNLPISYGNHTDICSTVENRDILIKLLEEQKKRHGQDRIAIISTKSILTNDFLKRISATGVRIIFFVSLAFNERAVEVGAATTAMRLRNLQLLSTMKIDHVHWWRPATILNLPNDKTIESNIKLLLAHGVARSVVVADMRTRAFRGSANNSIQLVHRVLAKAREYKYAAFSETSCAIATILNKPEALGISRKLYFPTCSASSCSLNQRKLCFDFIKQNQKPTKDAIAYVSRYLQLTEKDIAFDQTTETVWINALIKQSDEELITRFLGFPIVPLGLIPTRQW